MSAMCISVVGGNLTAAQINLAVNTYGGLGVVTVDQLPITGDKCQLENFGFAGGQYCADKCVLEGVQSASDICGIVIHNCETGCIEDWKPYSELTKMLTCIDGVWCFEFNCWNMPGKQCPVEETSDCIVLSSNPCIRCDQFDEIIDMAALGGATVSERKGAVAKTYCKADIPALERRQRLYRKRCQARCRRSGRRWTQQIRPHCTSA